MWSASQKYGSSQCSARTAASAARRTGQGLGADDRVLTVRLVPHRNHLDAVLQSLHTGLQLRFGLVREPVSNTDGILGELQMVIVHLQPRRRIGRGRPKAPTLDLQ